MLRFSTRAALVISLVCTSACTQAPASIDLKGQSNFTRSGGAQPSVASNVKSGYQPYQPAPVYTNTHVSQETVQNASVQSISSSDLAPPAKASPAAKPAVAAASQPVNKWTNKPHGAGDETSSIAKPSDKPVAQLDSVISKDAAKPKTLAANVTSKGFIWPVSGKKVISGFGPKGAGKANDGINIAAENGEPVWASADGEVVYVGNELEGYGNMVVLKHAGTKSTAYAHLSRATVDKYDRVKQGDIIGYVGSTGNVKAPQLHFAIRDGKDPVDPTKYVTTKVAGL